MGLNEHRERTVAIPRADGPPDGARDVAAAERRPSGLGAIIVPILLAIVLLPLTALLLRASEPGTLTTPSMGPLGTHAALLAAGSFICLGGLAWWYRARTTRPDDWGPVPHPTIGARLDVAISALLALAAIVTPITLLVLGGHGTPHLPKPRPVATPSVTRLHTITPPTPRASAPSQRHSTGSLAFLQPVITALAVIVVVAVVLAILWSIGRIFGWWHRDAVLAPGTPLDAEDDDALSEAVEAASGELRRLTDVRAAIIGCYAVMEATLRGAGVPRLAADSPEELLARAAAAGAIDTPAAAELTQLFREARYSTHPLTEHHRDAAAAALGTIRANLRERADAAANAWAEAAP